MLQLKNIVMTNGIIYADYIPESSGDMGTIAFDVKSKKVVEKRLSQMDNIFPLYFNKAQEWIRNVNLDSLPKERILMWY